MSELIDHSKIERIQDYLNRLITNFESEDEYMTVGIDEDDGMYVVGAYIEDKFTEKLKIITVNIPEEYKGYGTCIAVLIFLLRKLYNSILIDKEDIIHFKGYVEVISNDHEAAGKCYQRSFEALGFELIDNTIGRDGSSKFYMYFERERGEQIVEDIVYTSTRSNLTYIISMDNITVS